MNLSIQQKIFLLSKYTDMSEQKQPEQKQSSINKNIENDLKSNSTLEFFGWRTQKDKNNFYLSNFYYSPFIDDKGLKWGTSEAYFQAQKFANTSHLNSEEDIKIYQKMYELLRTQFKDAPAFSAKLSKAKVRPINYMTAFMGIDQPNKKYDSTDAKKEKFNKYVKIANEFISKYIKTDRLKPINIEHWNKTGSFDAMIKALVFKFHTDKEIQQKLVKSTERLVEVNPYDYKWAIGKSRTGTNYLGKMLTILRNVIQHNPTGTRDEWIESLSKHFYSLIKNNKPVEKNPLDFTSFINDNIAFGQYPTSDAVKKLEKAGYNIFIDLTHDKDLINPKYERPSNYYSFPIVDMSKPDDMKEIHTFLKNIIESHDLTKDKVYIHCKGGHGRAGMVTAILLMMLYGYDADKATKMVYDAHQKRKNIKPQFRKMGSPQTKSQKDFIQKFSKLL